MSLDKIMGTKPPKKTEKKTEKIELPSNRHYLICKCKKKRSLRKKTLEEADLVCDSCHAVMKEYTPRVKATSDENEED